MWAAVLVDRALSVVHYLGDYMVKDAQPLTNSLSFTVPRAPGREQPDYAFDSDTVFREKLAIVATATRAELTKKMRACVFFFSTVERSCARGCSTRASASAMRTERRRRFLFGRR